MIQLEYWMANQKTTKNTYPSPTWQDWVNILNRLKNDINSLIAKRKIWRIYSETSLENISTSEGIINVCDWINRNYVDSMLIGLRRLSDKRGGSQSIVTFLNRLKNDLEKDDSLIDLEKIKDVFIKTGDIKYKESRIESANDAFKNFSKDGKSFNVNEINAHIQMIRKNPLLDFTSDYIAHRKKSFEINSHNYTYEELHYAYDLLTDVYNEYYYLFTGSLVSFDNMILRPGLKEVFTRIFNENTQ